MGKIVRLTEGELTQVIENVIFEMTIPKQNIKQTKQFKDFLTENSEEKLNISDISHSRLSIQDMLKEIMDVVRNRNLHQKDVNDKSLLDYIQKELNYMKNGIFDKDGNLIRSQR